MTATKSEAENVASVVTFTAFYQRYPSFVNFVAVTFSVRSDRWTRVARLGRTEERPKYLHFSGTDPISYRPTHRHED